LVRQAANLDMRLHVSSRGAIRVLKQMSAKKLLPMGHLGGLMPDGVDVNVSIEVLRERWQKMNQPSGLISVDGFDYGWIWLDSEGRVALPIFYDPHMRENGNVSCQVDTTGDAVPDCDAVIGDIALVTWGNNGNPLLGIVGMPIGESLRRLQTITGGVLRSHFNTGMFMSDTAVPQAFLSEATARPQWLPDDRFWLLGVKFDQMCLSLALRGEFRTEAIARWATYWLENVCVTTVLDEETWCEGAFPLPSDDAQPAT
jgi:hypothetical protein